MLNSLLDTFINLDDKNKNKVLGIISNVLNPIKLYLIVVILLLLIMCISNYFLIRKIDNTFINKSMNSLINS
jgi:hypothetical protein